MKSDKEIVVKSKKLEVLFNVYEELSNELERLDIDELEPLLDAWKVSLGQVREIVGDSASPVKPSQLVAGFEQGLRDAQLILGDFPEQNRSRAMKVFRSIVRLHMPRFFEKYEQQLKRIVEKGKISNEHEWYLVRHRVDEIEGLESSEAEVRMLDELMAKYEASV